MNTYGLIGKKLSHSFSKTYFDKKFSNEGVNDCRYRNFEIGSAKEVWELLRDDTTIRGLHVTLPFKEDVVALLDKKSDAVKRIGAANTIKVHRKNSIELSGFNTDAGGFQNH